MAWNIFIPLITGTRRDFIELYNFIIDEQPGFETIEYQFTYIDTYTERNITLMRLKFRSKNHYNNNSNIVSKLFFTRVNSPAISHTNNRRRRV